MQRFVIYLESDDIGHCEVRELPHEEGEWVKADEALARIKELTTWIPCSEKLPRIETPVLIRFYNGTTRIGELRQEHPTWEETFRPYEYWDDPENDGQDWDWMDVTHWMKLPEIPHEPLT